METKMSAEEFRQAADDFHKNQVRRGGYHQSEQHITSVPHLCCEVCVQVFTARYAERYPLSFTKTDAENALVASAKALLAAHMAGECTRAASAALAAEMAAALAAE